MSETVEVKAVVVCDVCAGVAEGGTADGLNITENERTDSAKVIEGIFDNILHVSKHSRTLPYGNMCVCAVCKSHTFEYATIVGYQY